jgi:hypothetical protein
VKPELLLRKEKNITGPAVGSILNIDRGTTKKISRGLIWLCGYRAMRRQPHQEKAYSLRAAKQ